MQAAESEEELYDLGIEKVIANLEKRTHFAYPDENQQFEDEGSGTPADQFSFLAL